MDKRPVILDTDTGDDVDDVFAIALAAKAEAIDLLAVITAHGDTGLRAKLARRVLDEAGRKDVPVFAGHGINRSDVLATTSMESGKGFVPESAAVGESDGVDVMIELVKQRPGVVVVCAVGPLTNIAEAIRRFPAFAGQVGQLLIMGGRFPDGPQGEWNFNCDPVAACKVVQSDAEIAIGLIGPTRRAQIGFDQAARLRRAGTASGESLAGMLEQYLNGRSRQQTPMFDPATLGALIWPELYSWQRTGIAAELIDARMRLVPGQRSAELMEDIEADEFSRRMMNIILS